METLKDFHVKWTHVKMENHVPTTDLDKYLMKEMCTQAEAGVYLQCHREYWSTTEKRATAVKCHMSKERTYQPITFAVNVIWLGSGIWQLNQLPIPISFSKGKESGTI